MMTFSLSAFSESDVSKVINSGRNDHYAFPVIGVEMYDHLKGILKKYGKKDETGVQIRDIACYRVVLANVVNSDGSLTTTRLETPQDGCYVDDRELNNEDSKELAAVLAKIPGTTTGAFVENTGSGKIQGKNVDGIYMKVFNIVLINTTNECKAADDRCFMTLKY
jgi:hypothetical protein